MNNFQNEVQLEETIRKEITRLTAWDPKIITNSLTKLIDMGEMERVNEHKVRLNPEIANKYRMLFACKYQGKSPSYNDAQEKLISELETIIRTRDFLTEQEVLELQEVELEEEADMVAMQKIQSLEQTIESLKSEMKMQFETFSGVLKKSMDEVLGELRKHDPVAADNLKKRHLELVKD